MTKIPFPILFSYTPPHQIPLPAKSPVIIINSISLFFLNPNNIFNKFFKFAVFFFAVNFAEKHEVRQIYVRSTARVYEIYTNDEYLCTVRCGVAIRDGEVLRSNEIGEENVRNEDDWVEVKADDANSQTKPNLNLTTAAQVSRFRCLLFLITVIYT